METPWVSFLFFGIISAMAGASFCKLWFEGRLCPGDRCIGCGTSYRCREHRPDCLVGKMRL